MIGMFKKRPTIEQIEAAQKERQREIKEVTRQTDAVHAALAQAFDQLLPTKETRSE